MTFPIHTTTHTPMHTPIHTPIPTRLPSASSRLKRANEKPASSDERHVAEHRTQHPRLRMFSRVRLVVNTPGQLICVYAAPQLINKRGIIPTACKRLASKIPDALSNTTPQPFMPRDSPASIPRNNRLWKPRPRNITPRKLLELRLHPHPVHQMADG